MGRVNVDTLNDVLHNTAATAYTDRLEVLRNPETQNGEVHKFRGHTIE